MYAYDGDKAIKVHYFAAGYTSDNPNADNPIRIVAKTKPTSLTHRGLATRSLSVPVPQP